MITAVLQKTQLLIAACDGCGKKHGPYTATRADELPAGWIVKPHWGIHYLTNLHLCPVCATKEPK